VILKDARVLGQDIIAIIPALNGRQDIGLVKCGNMANNNRLQVILEKRRQRHQIKSDKKDNKEEKKENKRDYRLEKINAVKEKIYAVAAKRKWLFLIIAAAIVAYLVIFKGGFSFGGGSGILEKIKSFF
tara:strand:- start:72 stop:458 length:387 start_codon:yes stop_codon:yes gene_type:complete